jgi:hypothetical protein
METRYKVLATAVMITGFGWICGVVVPLNPIWMIPITLPSVAAMLYIIWTSADD